MHLKHKISARDLTVAVLMMDGDQFIRWIQSERTGVTNMAYRLGECMTESDLSLVQSAESKMREQQAKVQQRVNSHTTDAAISNLLKVSMIKQFFTEAIAFYRAYQEACRGSSVAKTALHFGVDEDALDHAINTRY